MMINSKRILMAIKITLNKWILCCLAVQFVFAIGCPSDVGNSKINCEPKSNEEGTNNICPQLKAFISSWEVLKKIKIPSKGDPEWKNAIEDYRTKHNECELKANELIKIVNSGAITEVEHKIIVHVVEVNDKFGQFTEEDIGSIREDDIFGKSTFEDEVILIECESAYLNIYKEIEMLRNLSKVKKINEWIFTYYINPISKSLVELLELIEGDKSETVKKTMKEKIKKDMYEVCYLLLKIYSINSK